jgi:hypothetical protein
MNELLSKFVEKAEPGDHDAHCVFGGRLVVYLHCRLHVLLAFVGSRGSSRVAPFL